MANYATLKAAINAVIKANGNKEITGTVLNETLTAMVNSLGANYQFAGVATPSTNPGTPDQNVFYLAGQAGTYTNFNGIVLPDGVSVLMWNGSWSSQAVLIGDGGVFDLSAYNAVGGVLAIYADLSAALTALNALPAAYKRGGMSFKFVQSSDNKYVQYRLMANSFTTDIHDWQGVDDEPTVGSDNLVKSGGVFDIVNDLSAFIGKTSEIIDSGELSGGLVMINTAPAVTSSQFYKITDYIPVNEGDIMSVIACMGTSGYAITGYSSQSQESYIPAFSIAGRNNLIDENLNYDFEVPNRVNYIRVSSKNDFLNPDGSITIYKNYPDSIIEQIKNLSEQIDGGEEERILNIPLNNNLVINADGTTLESQFYKTTDFIPVVEGEQMKFRSAGSYNVLCISAYTNDDMANIVLDSEATQTGVEDGGHNIAIDYDITIPSGIHYIRICRDTRVISGNTVDVEDIIVDLSLQEVKQKVLNLEKIIIGNYTVNDFPITTKGVVTSSGTTIIDQNSPYRMTDLISVIQGQRLKFVTAVSSGAFGVSAYTSNDVESIDVNSKASVLGTNESSVNEEYDITIPEGINYIRICRDSRINSSDTIEVEEVIVSGLSDTVKQNTEDIEKNKEDIAELKANHNSPYSILKSPATQPRKGFVAWCMDCGVNFFNDESKAYDAKLIAAGYDNTTYAVLPGDLSDINKKNLVKYFYDKGREVVIHSDSRIYEASTEALYEQLVQTYYQEMNNAGIIPAGGWISLGGNTVPYLTMLKKYVGWGQTGPKNYGITESDYLDAVNNIQTNPAHLMRLYIEQTPEQVTPEITALIVQRAKEVIDLAASNGSYIVFYTHSYNRPNAIYTLYDAVFEPILAYINEKHNKGMINIGSIGDMIEYYYSKRYNE